MIDKNKNILVIVESPNKCSHIKEYLKKAGYNVNVAASVGHISKINDGGSYYNTGIDPKNNFSMDLVVAPDKYEVVSKLKTLAKAADEIFIASDGDNEGAQICWSLIKFLDLPQDKCHRMITHEITPKAVVHALENPVPFDTTNAMASQARMCLDKIIGYRLSPIARTYIGAKSVGRCQSVGLKLVVDREKEIQNFKPEKYFNLYLNFSKNNTDFKAKYVGTDVEQIDKLKSLTDVEKIKYECNGDYIVKNIVKKEKQESPKPPFCTSTFQQEANSKLNLSVKDAMSIAQKLFEEGYITYHRTDDTEMSDDFIQTSLLPIVQEMFNTEAINPNTRFKKK